MTAVPAKASAADFAILDDLMRLVVRAFYQDELYMPCSVVVEILLREHRAISDEELAHILKLNTKQVRKYLSKLKDDHLITSTIKRHEKIDPETGEVIEGKKWQQQTFFYIEYKHFVDVVKYRLHMMEKKVTQADSSLENQLYNCPKCHQKYSALDANSILNPMTGSFQCPRCKMELVEEDNTKRVAESQTRKATMLGQLKPIIEQLKKTDGIVIPRIPLTQLVQAGKREEVGEDGEIKRVRGTPFVAPETVIEVTFAQPKANNQATEASVKVEKSLEPKAAADPLISVTTEPTVKELPPWLIRQPEKEITTEEEVEEAPVVTQVNFAEVMQEETHQDGYAQEYLQQLRSNGISSHDDFEPEVTEQDMEEGEDELIKVGDRSIPLSQITEEDKEKMTTEEYTIYFEKYNQKYGGNMDDLF